MYEIRVKGHMTERWSEWFDGLALRPVDDGDTMLTGALPDQAALLGVLNRLQALNVMILSLRRMPEGSPSGLDQHCGAGKAFS